jgi:multidrug efflux system membrane fusion protein
VRLGQTARVLLKNAAGEAHTLIPLGSVFQQGQQPAVWLIGKDGRVHLRPIQVAAWREDGVTVRGGLVEGERIVAAGAHKLVEGEAVRVAAP